MRRDDLRAGVKDARCGDHWGPKDRECCFD
jgi:hypothetical protein